MVSSLIVDRQNQKPSGQSGDNRTCFGCGKLGHIAPNSPEKGRNCFVCNKTSHLARDCPNRNRIAGVCDMTEEEGMEDDATQENMVTCGACTVVTDTLSMASSSMVASGRDPEPVYLASGILTSMPVEQGKLANKVVNVLRDTGCSGVVVRKSLIPMECFSGDTQLIRLADGSVLRVPIAEVEIDTPFFTGMVRAWCFDSPLYDVMVGNIPGAQDPDKPKSIEIGAVETRLQAKLRQLPYKGLKVPEIIKREITRDDLVSEQAVDPTLKKVRQLLELEANDFADDGKRVRARYFKHNGLIFREFQSAGIEDGCVYKQIVVPTKFRETVMRLAHESIMGAHLGTRKTVLRILSEFFWPGIQADTRRFCRSCDICQRTTPKGKSIKVPLQQMPLIEEPFQRVAVDLIGPLLPVTSKGNRYILTLVDYATRFPEAVPLPSIQTERVAEAHIDIFCRVGVPREMLSDMGTQFVSGLMSEVSRLVSLKQLTTTPYHPMCNGLVEKFNGTLKQMLKRLCFQKPKDWDKYINAALFAYREVPQESLGFSPFELVYGRHVRGPMTILKELWSNDIADPEVKTTYQHVTDLQEKFYSYVPTGQK